MVTGILCLLIASGPQVAPGGADLRQYCALDSPVVARLEEGAPLVIRSSISGEAGTCYRVAAGERTGYLFASQVAGTDSYESGRREADTASLPAEIRSAVAQQGVDSTVGRALALLEARQPRQALQLVEYAMTKEGANDAGTLALAGMAAYQSDQPRKALEYWRRSHTLRPDPRIAALAARAAREAANDTSGHVLHGGRFVLRYDQASVRPAAAAVMISALEEEYARLDAALGCSLGEQVTVIVHTPEGYRAATGAAEWSGGQYDGRIRVAAPAGAGVGPELRRTFAHEIVHACLARRGMFPAWFHEGMAQRWSGERLSGPQRRAIRDKVAAGTLPPLGRLGASWAGFSPAQAGLAYAYALAAVEVLYETRGEAHVRDLLRTPARMAQTADELTRALAP
jgi:hypothetical protein